MISLLYVDDEQELLNLGKLFLERGGEFTITTTTSSTEGLLLLTTEPFDGVISDYQMPEMDGIELLKRVRGAGLTLPFILFTGKGREEIVIEAINNGADFYLQKGGDARPQFAELRHKILTALERRQAVDALRDSEQKLADIINFLPDATFAINTEGKVIAWNKAIETMTGIPAPDILGKGEYEYALPFYQCRRPILANLVLEPDALFESKHYIAPCHAGTTLTAESIVKLSRTGPAHIWAKASPLFDKSGKITGAIESIRDVTEQKQVDRTLKESEVKYRELVENANSIILKMDRAGNVTFFNEYAQRFFGFSATEIIGRPVVGTVVPLQESASHRDLSRMIEKIIHSPEEFRNNENENVTKSGRRVWIHWWNQPIFSKEGVFEGLLSVGTDITARKQIEDELRMENEKNRGLMNNASDAIFIADLETGRFTDANTRALELVGTTKDDLTTMQFIDIFPPASQEIYQDQVRQVAMEGTGSRSLTVVDRTGTPVPVIASLTEIDLGGRRHLMGIFHDISEIQMAQDALQLVNKKLNLLSEITRHDIRNKLTVLGGYLHLLKEQPSESDYPMYVRKINDIVEDIGNNIEFTRLYQNLGIAAPHWQNVHEVFFQACTHIDTRKIRIQSDTGTLEIYADPLLERAFFNIVENALTHGGHVTTIRISAAESGAEMVIYIEDDGTGILPSDKEKIFSKGYGKNTGLGLFLVREIFSITGIRLTETGEYQKGATFTLRVPQGSFRFSGSGQGDRCHIRTIGSDAESPPGC